MQYLKDLSLKVFTGMEIIWPTTGISDMLNLMNIVRRYGKAKVFAVGEKSRSILYIRGENIYVTPYTRIALRILKQNGYRQEYLKYVPFDLTDEPRFEQTRWDELIHWAESTYREDFTNDCLEYADNNGIGKLPRHILNKCLEIPERGLAVRNNVFEESIYPILDKRRPDDHMIKSYVGRYSTQQGITLFIYRDGRTFLAKGRGITRRLKRRKYQETGIFVPLSNGALPVDKRLRSEWDALPTLT